MERPTNLSSLAGRTITNLIEEFEKFMPILRKLIQRFLTLVGNYY